LACYTVIRITVTFFLINLFLNLFRRKKKCIRFIVGADGETTEVLDKEQTEINSDSDNENNTTNINNNTTTTDSKENLQDRVTMAPATAGDRENKMVDPSATLNNNNNNSISSNLNILSSTSQQMASVNNVHPPPSYASKHHDEPTITSLHPPAHSLVYSGSGVSSNNAYNTSQSIRTDTVTIDTSVLKTISAPCS